MVWCCKIQGKQTAWDMLFFATEIKDDCNNMEGERLRSE